MRFFSLARQHQRRATVFLDYAGGGDPDHAAMPALAFDHHAIVITQRRFFFQPAIDALEDAALFILTLCVELIETPGDLAGTIDLFHTEQFHHVAGRVHASRGVQARGDAESDLGGGESSSVAQLGDFEQRLQPDIDGRTQACQTETGKDAVFSEQGDRVGDGCDGDNLHERHQQS